MTSTEISTERDKILREGFTDQDQLTALLEIAFQLARFNEREEAKERHADAWRVACEPTTGKRV